MYKIIYSCPLCTDAYNVELHSVHMKNWNLSGDFTHEHNRVLRKLIPMSQIPALFLHRFAEQWGASLFTLFENLKHKKILRSLKNLVRTQYMFVLLNATPLVTSISRVTIDRRREDVWFATSWLAIERFQVWTSDYQLYRWKRMYLLHNTLYSKHIYMMITNIAFNENVNHIPKRVHPTVLLLQTDRIQSTWQILLHPASPVNHKRTCLFTFSPEPTPLNVTYDCINHKSFDYNENV